MEEDNVIRENVEFNEELYNKNIFETEYEAGEDNANN
jgi:hypothetical protein